MLTNFGCSNCFSTRPVTLVPFHLLPALELSNIPADMFGGSDALISCTGRRYENCGSHALCVRVTDVNGA